VAWFKVDDKLHDHRKVRKLGPGKLPGLGSVDHLRFPRALARRGGHPFSLCLIHSSGRV
jgi:hypothetical protein